jgi:hypothetical protein
MHRSQWHVVLRSFGERGWRQRERFEEVLSVEPAIVMGEE